MPTKPNPVAVEKFRSQTAVGSPLNTEGWSKVPIGLRDSAFFSATVESFRLLQRMQDRLQTAIEVVRREEGAFQSREKFIAEMQRIAREEGLDPANFDRPDLSGGLQDVTSLKRLGLIYDVQTENAQEFAKWKMDQDPDVLNAYPAQEFIRVSPRKHPRSDWLRRWKAAGGKLYKGRMIALKTDPVWKKLSRFGKPWPPFDFGSGMGLRDISRREAVQLGLMKETDRIKPIEQDFNQELQASVKDLSPKMQSALKRAFGDQVKIGEDGVARWNPKGSPPPGRPPLPPPIAPRPPRPAPPAEPPPIVPPEAPPIAPPKPKASEPVPADSTRHPKSTAVSAAARVEVRTKREALRYKETLDAIDKVHGDGPLTPIPINNRIMRGSLGTYYSGQTEAMRIGVRGNIGEDGELTLAHEVGHWIDHVGIKSDTKFASESDALPEMRSLMSAIRRSDAIKKISEQAPSRFRSYLLSGREEFARAYSQFIAEQSGRSTMVATLKKKNERQWSEEDFAPIRREFAKLFRSLGWMK